jgi:hypothetical protein
VKKPYEIAIITKCASFFSVRLTVDFVSFDIGFSSNKSESLQRAKDLKKALDKIRKG